nr:retrovirus-related Pol polyprotein from transposon TNT 1-94 [Tanacetum cinerariifolium]
MSSDTKLTKDEECESVDSIKYRGMIGSLVYVTASWPDIMFSVCLCARFQEAPKTSHLEAVKRIFRYIKGTTHLGLWYSKGTGIETIVFSESDHAGDYVDQKSTSGICTAILVPWRQSHDLSLSPPSPPPNRTPPTSPITNNSLPSSSPSHNSTQKQIVHDRNELHYLSNIIDIKHQQEIKATNPSPLTSPCVFLATLDQVNFHLDFCHCCLETPNLFDILRDDLNHIKSLIIVPST